MTVRILYVLNIFLLALVVSLASAQTDLPKESKDAYTSRMQWWNEARFGLFIHWGLYSIPAGEWKGETGHAEWIRTTAHIPIEEYEKFVPQFNPTKFDPDEWVRMAKEAGMKYIVITSKHHDGFSLFDSKYTDFDVMATPYQRDILRQLSDACNRGGIKLCFYYSIMDWRHPDYLPHRDWETTRTTQGADYSRFLQYEKDQLRELLTNYGDLGVLWFDGNWDGRWNNELGKELYAYVRSLQPDCIINDRVGWQSGLTLTESDIVGDYRTPEQTIPATGLPDIFWETCMTMNDHWGYNSHDNNFKSTKELIEKLADIASKGGNFLLNVGPTAEGLFPDASIERLKEIGKWMKTNSEAIYGTTASPFSQLEWGRCTKKEFDVGTRLYFHVFTKPSNGKLVIHGIANDPGQAFLLGDAAKRPLPVTREDDALVIRLPGKLPDPFNNIVILDITGAPDVAEPPRISAPYPMFIDEREVAIQSGGVQGEARYTLDGSIPTMSSELVKGTLKLQSTTTVSARWFREGEPLSETARLIVTKVLPRTPSPEENLIQGVRFKYFEGDWDSIPDFSKLQVVQEGVLPDFSFSPRNQKEHFGFEYSGYIKIEKDDVYSFFTNSDDGSQLFIGDALIVDNNYLHPMQEEEGIIALSAGVHPFRITFFEKTGDDSLIVSIKSMSTGKQVIPGSMLFTDSK